MGVSRSITRPEIVVARGFELEPLVGIERRQVVEEDLVARFLRRFEVDGVDLDEREIAFAFLGRADLAGDGIAGAQIEAADLRRRNIHVVRAGQIIVLGRAQEAETVGQAFQHAFGEDQAALLGLRLQDLENQLLFAQSGGAGDVQILGDLVEVLDAHVLELHQIERAVLWIGLRRTCAAVALAPAGLSGGLVRLAIIGRGCGLSGLGFRCCLAVTFGGGFSVRFIFGFLGGGSGYCRWVLIVLIACQISLAPRQLTAENGRGWVSGDWLRMAARPCR